MSKQPPFWRLLLCVLLSLSATRSVTKAILDKLRGAASWKTIMHCPPWPLSSLPSSSGLTAPPFLSRSTRLALFFLLASSAWAQTGVTLPSGSAPYSVTASDTTSSHPPANAFDGNPATFYDTGNFGNYVYGTGAYDRTKYTAVSTSSAAGVKYWGDWLQLSLTTKFFSPTAYSIYFRGSGSGTCNCGTNPVEWVVLGSNGADAWYLVDQQTAPLGRSNIPFSAFTFNIYGGASYYSMFRLVALAVDFNIAMNVPEWTLTGTLALLPPSPPPSPPPPPPSPGRGVFTCTQSDAVCSALGDFYYSTGGASWSRRAGWSSAAAGTPTNYCAFTGMICSGTGVLTYFQLDTNNLAGSIPSSFGPGLTSLTRLCVALHFAHLALTLTPRLIS
jgi:hypothetical protein